MLRSIVMTVGYARASLSAVILAFRILRAGRTMRDDAGSGLASVCSIIVRTVVALRLRPVREDVRKMWRSVMRISALRGAR